MIRKRFQGMVTTVKSRGGQKEDMDMEKDEAGRSSEDPGKMEEGLRVSEMAAVTVAEDKVGSEDKGDGAGGGGFGCEEQGSVPGGSGGVFGSEAQGSVPGRDEKAYARTRRRPHRKLRLFEDEDDDDMGVIGAGFGLQEGGSLEGRAIVPDGNLHEVDVKDSIHSGAVGNELQPGTELKPPATEGKIPAIDVKVPPTEVEGPCTEVKISGEEDVTGQNEAKGEADIVEFRVLRKRKKLVIDDEGVDRDDRGEGVGLERKRRRRGMDDGVVQRKVLGDGKIERQVMGNDEKKPGERTGGDLISDVRGHRVSGNSAEIDGGKRIEKVRESKDRLALAVRAKKGGHKMSNGVAIESLKRGILLRPSAAAGPVRRHKLGPRAGSPPVVEAKSGPLLKKSRLGASSTQQGRKALDQNSLGKNKADVQGKRNATPEIPKSEKTLAALQKQQKLLRSSKGKVILKETKDTVSSSDEETETMRTSLGRGRRSGEASSLKETKTMKRNARSEARRKLRERLRDALLAAGYTIDLRPRRGKNYDDNVYISPSGTSYWSLPKAWNALMHSVGQNCGNGEEKQGAKGGVRDDNMLAGIIACNEDLSLLKRKRRKDSEKGEEMMGNKKGGKRFKRQKISHKADSDEIFLSDFKSKDGKKVKFQKHSFKADNDGITLSDMKFKEKKKKHKFSGSDVMDPTSKQSDKRNISDKNLKRRLHGDLERKHSSPKALSNGVKNGLSQVKKNKSRRGGCGLLVRSSGKGDKRTGEQSAIVKRTVLSWSIDVGVVPDKELVQYWNKMGTRVMLEGWVQKDGILCECCKNVIPVSLFEDHAGAKQYQHFENIYLRSGKSLTQCLLEAWDTLDESKKCGKTIIEVDEHDPDDDTCGLCGDGGDLICCDKCPSTFHKDCLKLKDVPPGDWYCLNCTCGICGTVGHVDKNLTGEMTDVLLCAQCQREYHKSCLKDKDMLMSCSISSDTSFCGKACEKVNVGLHSLLGKREPLGDGFSWTLLRRFDDDEQSAPLQGLSLPIMAECNAKLAVAHIVMDECFMPIVDNRTNIDMVSNVVFSCWSNFNRLNYKGFYTAVLEKDDELISVASIRIHGVRLAEMPLIGTRHHYRRQGMCRRLVNAVEKMLLTLEVEKLILPAVPDLLQTWTEAFGFNPLEDSHKDEIKHLNLMVFPGTDLLQKQIYNRETLSDQPTERSACQIPALLQSH